MFIVPFSSFCKEVKFETRHPASYSEMGFHGREHLPRREWLLAGGGVDQAKSYSSGVRDESLYRFK
jgi:hypothetical protein